MAWHTCRGRLHPQPRVEPAGEAQSPQGLSTDLPGPLYTLFLATSIHFNCTHQSPQQGLCLLRLGWLGTGVEDWWVLGEGGGGKSALAPSVWALPVASWPHRGSCLPHSITGREGQGQHREPNVGDCTWVGG